MNKTYMIFAIVSVAFLVGCGSDSTKQDSTAPQQQEVATASGVVKDNIPEDCVSWFDGCNTCSVGQPGQPMACTKMACKQIQKPYCKKYEDGSSDAPIVVSPVSPEVQEGLKNSTYNINGQKVTLIDGKNEIAAAPGSATKIITQTTDFMAEGDLQQVTGATLDGAVVLVQDPGGSGTFYYVGATLLQSDGTYVAADNTYLLGDRIIVKNIKIDGRMIYVTYLIREDDVPMSMDPTVEVTKQYATKGNTLMDVTPFEPIENNDVVGNDKDEHGCIGSAGYTWNEQAQKCERPWEEK